MMTDFFIVYLLVFYTTILNVNVISTWLDGLIAD